MPMTAFQRASISSLAIIVALLHIFEEEVFKVQIDYFKVAQVGIVTADAVGKGIRVHSGYEAQASALLLYLAGAGHGAQGLNLLWRGSLGEDQLDNLVSLLEVVELI